MSDLIDRKKTLDEISKIDTSIIPSGWVKGYVDETIKETQRIIRTIPSAEPDRKKGKWIFHLDDLFPEESTQECSVCHEEESIKIYNDNFCPNCGAEMREEHEDIPMEYFENGGIKK